MYSHKTVRVHRNNNHTHGHKAICAPQEHGSESFTIYPIDIMIASKLENSMIDERIPNNLLKPLHNSKLIEPVYLSFGHNSSYHN